MKVIACAVVALATVSAALIALSFSPQPASLPNSSPTPPSPSASHMFDVDLVYAYVGPTNAPEHSHFGMQVHPENLYPVFVYINYTYLGNADYESCDAKFEGYLVQFVSDTGVSASYTAYEGVQLNQFPSAWPVMPSADTVHWRLNMTVNESFLGMHITDRGSFTSGNSNMGLWSSGAPSTITLTLRRLGWWTVQGDSISILSNPAGDGGLLEVQLEEFGNGFLYNKRVPENKLTQMNPFDPPV